MTCWNVNPRLGAAAILALSAGCVGAIGDDGASKGSAGSKPNANAAASWPVRYGGTPSGLRRLSRDELVTSMRQLTGVAPARADLPAEPRSGLGPLHTAGLPYVANELPKLNLVIRDFAEGAAPEVLGATGCAAEGQAQRDCLQSWSLAFAERALRRPLRAGESDLFSTLVASADGTAAADEAAVGAVLRATFFSPSFLYRSEIGAEAANASTVRSLTAAEIAVRLSYLATLGPPDTDLSNAAASGALGDADGRLKEFRRLLQSAEGRHALAVFVLEWLGANESKISTKSAKYTAGLSSEFEPSIRSSAEGIIAGAMSEGNASLETLLTTRSYATDPAVAEITGPSAEGPNATGDTELTDRQGLLMHPMVLSGHTKEDGVSPFQLGRFLRESVLCEPLSPPPANAAQKALPDLPAGASLRDRFQHKISAGPTCIACHAQFSPLGYSFLPFDPVGRWLRDDPSGVPWDLSGTIPTYSGTLSFESPGDLVAQLGRLPQVHGCFAQAAVEWAFGRGLVQEDEAIVHAVDAIVRGSDGDVLEIFEAIVGAPGFITVVRGS